MAKILKTYWYLVLPVLLFVLFVVNISLGSVQIPLSETFKVLVGKTPSQPVWADIIIDFRLTKALTCILAGGALALGGLLMQTLFRNPLAGPDVLGLSSGASLAVAMLLMSSGLGSALFAHSFTLALAASIGCTVIFLIVLGIAQRVTDNVSLLIIGLMIGAATSSIVSVLQFVSKAEDQQYYIVWTFGSLSSLNWGEIQILTGAVLIGITIAVLSIKSLNAWLLGDNYAMSLGVSIKKSRLLIIIGTCILTGAVTAFCGPIAFVGIAVPHLARLVIDTTNHKLLIPAVVLCGGVIMLFCDILTRFPGSDLILPVNAITALIGAPVVIWVILRSKKVRI
ncbi:MAG TPA: iron ABC transporter permease [Cyclobacteriaceae bacterium]|nr:iron ABC transporter permease [Cyclobacteriaceae bacterium]